MHWIKLLYQAAEECLLFTGTSMYLLYLVIYRVQQVQEFSETFQDGGRYHIETSPLANQWTGFYMITAYVLKELSK